VERCVNLFNRLHLGSKLRMCGATNTASAVCVHVVDADKLILAESRKIFGLKKKALWVFLQTNSSDIVFWRAKQPICRS